MRLLFDVYGIDGVLFEDFCWIIMIIQWIVYSLVFYCSKLYAQNFKIC